MESTSLSRTRPIELLRERVAEDRERSRGGVQDRAQSLFPG